MKPMHIRISWGKRFSECTLSRLTFGLNFQLEIASYSAFLQGCQKHGTCFEQMADGTFQEGTSSVL
jgi:hypothetical protein